MSKALHQQLIEGLTVKSRKDGSVHTIKDADGEIAAEVCVGTKRVRLNLRESVKAPKGVTMDGKSKSWACGVVVTEENVTAVRKLLAQVVAPSKPAAPTRKAA